MTVTPGEDTAAYLARQFGPCVTTRLATPEQRDTARRVFQQITDQECADTARAWMTGINPHLDDQSPIHTIADGRAHDVEAAAHAYPDGAWT